jgi:hypothetical protein
VVISKEQIKKDLQDFSAVKCADNFYVLPALDYLIEEFLPWFNRHLVKRGMVFHAERFDCDDFAQEFASRLREAGLSLKENAGVAVATLQVNNKTWSLGVKEGEHMLNLVCVKTKNNYDWLVVEPQNQKHVFLKDYKSADNLRVVF